MAGDRPPSQGERSALAGYVPQYLIAATLIYDCLREAKLDWVRIADPEAGRVDDIQIATPGRVDAYQVKWALAPQFLSFNDLIRDEKQPGGKTAPNLVRQLADGRQRLQALHNDVGVYVHLIHCDLPSPRAQIPFDGPSNAPHGLAAFLDDCWSDASVDHAIPTSSSDHWRTALRQVRHASGLTDEEFPSFMQSSRIHLGWRLAPTQAIPGRSDTRRKTDIAELMNKLLELVSSPSQVVHIERDQLLRIMGWDRRFSHVFEHEFPIDALYEPIETTNAELADVLARYLAGYVALIGTPGSGKSTTLTKFFRYRPHCRVIRYYAYVPDHTAQGRGESTSFLHDITVSLARHGIYGDQGSVPVTREELTERFSVQLSELADDWKQEGVPTYIVVDGLDHIEREQSPARSLLEDLPHPSTIPDGVVFILGTQTIELSGLSPAIKVNLRESGRTLAMQSLSRQSIFSILEKAHLPYSLSLEDAERFDELSGRHPLATRYLIEKLRHAEDADAAHVLLGIVDPYEGHIDRIYSVYWERLKDNHSIRTLLALLARIRIPFNPSDLNKWSDESTANDFIRDAQHFFLRESRTRWRFFHNSFRYFILRMTSTDLQGDSSSKIDKQFHRRLAALAESDPVGTRWNSERLYHLARAEEWDSVLEVGKQEYFRAQFFAFAPSWIIRDDIGWLARAAQCRSDGLAFLRAVLIDHELAEREFNLDEADLLDLMVRIKGVDYVADSMFDGHNLRMNRRKALNLSGRLAIAGHSLLAKKLFEASEPHELLAGTVKVNSVESEKIASIEAWASVAANFRTVEEILTVIDQVGPEFGDGGETRESKAESDIKVGAISALVQSICETGQDRDIEQLRRTLEERHESAEFLRGIDASLCFQRRDTPLTREALARLENWAAENKLNDSNRILLAEFVYRILGDRPKSERWLQGIDQPDLSGWKRDAGQNWASLDVALQRIRFNRLLSAFGRPVDPVSAVPDPEDPRDLGTVYFERNIVLVANLWGQGWAGRRLAPSEVANHLRPALRFFHRSHIDARDWINWHQLGAKAGAFFQFMISAVREHGLEQLEALGAAFNEIWHEEATGRFWLNATKIEIAAALYQSGGRIEEFTDRISACEAAIGVQHEIYARTEEYAKIAAAWLDVDRPDRALIVLRKVMETSFGVYEDKDYRFLQWVRWLAKAIGAGTPSIMEDIRRFAGALVVLQQSHRGRGAEDAALLLISVIARTYPGYVLSLRQWLHDRYAIRFTTALEGLILGAIQDGGACSEIAAVLVTHLVLPFEDAVPTDLVRTVVTKCQSKRSRVELDRSIIGLIEGVATKAFPSNRRLWLRTIAIGLSDAGVSSPQLHRDLEDAPSKDDGTTYPHVVLRSGIRLGEDEVRLKLHSLSDLLELIGDIDKVEYFHWEEVLGPIVSSCSREQVEQIRRELAQFRPGPLATCLFAERLAQLGLDAEARTMAESVLDQSLPTGWDRWYDGGSRLKALKTLAGLDPKYWRPKALARLVEDYLTEFRNPSAVLRNLDDICEIIFEDVPINGVWREIAEHVYQLYEFTQLTEVGPEIPGGAESISHAEMLIRATISTAVVPIVEIRESAHEAMCRMVEGGMNDEYTQKCVLRMMKSDQYDLRIAGLSVLDSVASIRHEFVQGCSDLIKGLSVSPNYRERLIAVEISRRIGIAAREISQDRRKLPSTYQFVFAHIDASKEVFPAEGLPQGSALPDTKDEVQLVRLFLPTIEWLSSLSGIPKENLLHRASRLMHTLVPEALWNKQAEEGVQSWEAGAGLGIAYLRPRPRVALLASSYVVGELVDSGAIPAGAQEALWDALAPHDRLLSRLLPTSTTPSLWWIARLDDGERLLKEGFQHGPPQRGQALSALGGESPGPGQRGWVRAGLGRSSAEG